MRSNRPPVSKAGTSCEMQQTHVSLFQGEMHVSLHLLRRESLEAAGGIQGGESRLELLLQVPFTEFASPPWGVWEHPTSSTVQRKADCLLNTSNSR